MKKIILILLICISVAGRSQNIVGYWYGSGNVNLANANNYLLELIVKQNSNNSIQAIFNYYFKNSYRSTQVNGIYDPKTRQFTLFNIAIPYYGSTAKMEVDCVMDFVATHRIAQAGSNLIGSFMGRENYKNTCPQ